MYILPTTIVISFYGCLQYENLIVEGMLTFFGIVNQESLMN